MKRVLNGPVIENIDDKPWRINLKIQGLVDTYEIFLLHILWFCPG